MKGKLKMLLPILIWSTVRKLIFFWNSGRVIDNMHGHNEYKGNTEGLLL